MGIQREVRRDFRTQAEIQREIRSERLAALTTQIEAEIDAMKALPDGEYHAVDLHELETQLRRLADRAQVAGSTFTSRS
ncbi:hypothetical protein ACV229_26545 [Burkholderia sp. MR1-5-21]